MVLTVKPSGLSHGVRRRDFIRQVAAATGFYLLPLSCSRAGEGQERRPEASRRGRIVLARLPGSGKKQEPSLMKDALNRSMERLTGQQGAAAWSRFFGARDKVGIKLSCLSPALSPSVELVQAIVEGLRSAGVPDGNILIWERTSRELGRAGFKLHDGTGVQCYGTDRVGYDPVPEISGSVGTCFSRIVSSVCTALISVPVLKDHDLAGVSLGMKNYYGAIHNPNKYHGGDCNPYVAELFNHRYIRGKTRLTVLDGIKAQCQGGPAYAAQWVWPCRTLLISQDPVAADTWGMLEIEGRRKKLGLPTLAEAERYPAYIRTAGQLGLGESDASKLVIEEA